jgi:hypothetical protein
MDAADNEFLRRKSFAATRSMEWDLTNPARGSRLRMDKILTTKKSIALKRTAKATRKKRQKDAICAGCNS